MEGAIIAMYSIIGEIVKREAKSIGIFLSDQQIKDFEVYAVELIKWNNKVNLTAITKPEDIAIKHFVDSFYLASKINENDYLLDIGSGAGFPVIPLKILRPEIAMLSVDAVAKKINFQRHIIRILHLQLIGATHSRVEDLQNTYCRAFSVITSRAFTRLDHFVALAEPLLAEDGVLVALKGALANDEISVSNDIVRASGFTITSVSHYILPQNMGTRALIFIKRSNSAS